MLDLSRRCLDRQLPTSPREDRRDCFLMQVRSMPPAQGALFLIPRTTVSLSTQHTVSTGHWHSGQRAVVSIGTGRKWEGVMVRTTKKLVAAIQRKNRSPKQMS